MGRGEGGEGEGKGKVGKARVDASSLVTSGHLCMVTRL